MTIARACRPPAQELCQRLAGRWWIAQHPPRSVAGNRESGCSTARGSVPGPDSAWIGVFGANRRGRIRRQPANMKIRWPRIASTLTPPARCMLSCPS